MPIRVWIFFGLFIICSMLITLRTYAVLKQKITQLEATIQQQNLTLDTATTPTQTEAIEYLQKLQNLKPHTAYQLFQNWCRIYKVDKTISQLHSST